MPTYEYKCEACGFKFEKFQSIKSAPIRKCPHCGKNRVKRLIGTGSGLIFKGGGFYETDYRSEAYKSAAKADAKAGAGTSSPAKESTTPTGTGSTAEAAPKPAGDAKPAATPKPAPEVKTASSSSAKPAKRAK
jgi:putative FmdB family regulatory protein